MYGKQESTVETGFRNILRMLDDNLKSYLFFGTLHVLKDFVWTGEHHVGR